MSGHELLLTIISISLFILLLIVAVILTFNIAGKQKIQQQVALSEARLAFERELRTVEGEVTENMMKQFAQELHDNIGQLLTALHIQVENQKLDHPDIADSFKPAEIYISEINQQLRLLSRTLNNDYLGHIGLGAALQVEVTRLNALKRFEVHYQGGPGTSNLEKNQELMLFRIFQEITQNALRHAKAKNLYVKVENAGNSFRLEVRDDGQGFDKESIMQSSKSSGLRNISKRAALAGLDLQMDSSPGKGSLFIIEKKDNLG